MKARTRFFFWWILAVVIALGFEVLFTDFRSYRWQNVLENILFAIGMLLTLVFFDSEKIKQFLVNFYFVVFIFCLFFESAFFYLFNAIFNASSVFILLETNPAEIQEFLGFYLDMPVLCYLLVLMIVLILYLRTPKPKLFEKVTRRTKIFSAILFFSLLAFLKLTALIVPNLPYLVLNASLEYVQAKQHMAQININGPTGDFEHVSDDISTKKSLYVLIIGESTTRGHMGIYGYYRPTTPKLNEIKDELLVYQNVISSHSHTILSLRDALTLHGFQKKEESSIVQLMNRAGFKTFWLSNQRPLGTYDSFTTKLAQASDVLKFSNSAVTARVTNFDGVLLENFTEALADPVDKKFIVLHLLGTHLGYKYRYPESFTFFTEKPAGKFTDEQASATINHYDDAVRYNDYVVRKIIEKTRTQDVPSYVLYFSDHGEEVYETRHFAGHTEANATRNMYEIPFILWRSEKFKENYSIYESNLKKPYILDDFIFSLADLSQLDFSEMQERKSIFSKEFQPKKRIVGEGIDFDAFFLEKKGERLK